MKLELPIDMNNKKIINVADGVDDNDVVNVKQLNVDPNPNWYYFINGLVHSNKQVVEFRQLNKFPFSVDSNTNYMKISKSGTYQINYTDYHNDGSYIVLYDETNNKDLYRLRLFSSKVYKFISFTAVFQINLKDNETYNEISIFLEGQNSFLAGFHYSSFFIKYLHD